MTYFGAFIKIKNFTAEEAIGKLLDTNSSGVKSYIDKIFIKSDISDFLFVEGNYEIIEGEKRITIPNRVILVDNLFEMISDNSP